MSPCGGGLALRTDRCPVLPKGAGGDLAALPWAVSGTDVAPERPPARDLRPPSTGRDVAFGLALAALVVVQLVVDPPRAVVAGSRHGVAGGGAAHGPLARPLASLLGVTPGVAAYLLLVGGADPPFGTSGPTPVADCRSTRVIVGPFWW